MTPESEPFGRAGTPTAGAAPVAPLLRAEGVTKDYPGVRALDGVGLEVRPGEIHALVGENGAGKSTLVQVLGGGVRPDAGRAELFGAPLPFGDPVAIRARGLGILYQESTLVGELEVWENVFLGRERSRGGRLDRRAMIRRTDELLDGLGLACGARATVGRLGVGLRQMVEVARALALEARLFVLDEPSTALTGDELAHLFATLRSLRARGHGVVYISHRLEEVFALCDRLTVLRDGRVVATAETADVDRDGLIRWMVGRPVEEEFPPRPEPAARAACAREPVLEAEHLSCEPYFRDVSLRLARGEILGLAGLVGAGRTSLGRALCGDLVPQAGTLRLGGRPVRFRHPREALRAGIGYLAEDRKRHGVFAELGVDENVTLPRLSDYARGGLLSRRAVRAAAAAACARFGVKAASVTAAIRTLSGGNQQKALIARLLLRPLDVLVLDEPTRGVDVGARAEIYALVRSLVDAGLAILMISSELTELLGTCDRIAVLREGASVGTLSAEEATQERIMHLATGGAHA